MTPLFTIGGGTVATPDSRSLILLIDPPSVVSWLDRLSAWETESLAGVRPGRDEANRPGSELRDWRGDIGRYTSLGRLARSRAKQMKKGAEMNTDSHSETLIYSCLYSSSIY